MRTVKETMVMMIAPGLSAENAYRISLNVLWPSRWKNSSSPSQE